MGRPKKNYWKGHPKMIRKRARRGVTFVWGGTREELK